MSTADNVTDFVAKEGEQLIVQATCTGSDGNAADFTGRTVVFNMRRRGSTTPIITAGPCTLVGAATLGVAKYTGHVADTTAYQGEVEADFLSYITGQDPTTDAGQAQKFPNGKNENLLGFISPKVA